VDQSSDETTIHQVFGPISGSHRDELSEGEERPAPWEHIPWSEDYKGVEVGLDGMVPLVYANDPGLTGNLGTRDKVVDQRNGQRHVRPPMAPRTEQEYQDRMRSINTLPAELIRIQERDGRAAETARR
jgi:hypothetical protein